MKQLEYCKVCQNRMVSRTEGIICGLTHAKPTFEEICLDFKEDELQKKRLKRFQKSYNQQEIHFENAKKSLMTGLPLTSIGALIYLMPALNFGLGFLILLGAIAFLAGLIFSMFAIIQFVGIKQQNKNISTDNKKSFHEIDDKDEIY